MDQDQVDYHDGASILRAPLPRVLTRDGYRTTSSAWHQTYYLAKMGVWDIKKDVRHWTSSKHLKPGHLSVHAQSVLQHEGYVGYEHYLCGDEPSICGRYGQNALGPTSAVAFHNGVKFRFGDYKVCEESKHWKNRNHIPDFVGVSCPAANREELEALPKDEKPSMVLVGEAKTAWKHNLHEHWRAYREDRDDDEDLRHAFGQIASYMYQFKMRYGFLTTYDYTIFLKQVLWEGKEPRLYFTPPIEASSSPEASKDAVSIRQCFYYLLSTIKQNGDHIIENTILLEKWVGPRSGTRSNDPVTPMTQNTILQMTPTGMTPLPASSPLQLHREGLGFKATILFLQEHVRGFDTDERSVTINGKLIKVVIDGDDTSDSGDDDSTGCSNSQQGLPKRGFGYPILEEGEQARKKLTVSFAIPHGEDRRRTGLLGEIRPRRGVVTSELPPDTLQSPSPVPRAVPERGALAIPY
ncbi:hypothetical protein FQN50_000949 [Emmonsiellopsis sp. PD_5]|nr:hypothetical protein FQN50_000949 [Emmonsiellopsis sp. PD_5]